MLLLPEGSHLTSARPSQGTCEGETRAVLCVLEGLEPGERATVKIVAEPPRGAGVWSVLGAVTSITPDPNPVNNTRKAKVR
jgi:Na+-transporting NADH:ubiquinone oxidoreductase subunit NqrC